MTILLRGYSPTPKPSFLLLITVWTNARLASVYASRSSP